MIFFSIDFHLETKSSIWFPDAYQFNKRICLYYLVEMSFGSWSNSKHDISEFFGDFGSKDCLMGNIMLDKYVLR